MDLSYDSSSCRQRLIDPIGVRTNMVYDGVPSVNKSIIAIGVRTSMIYYAVPAVDKPIIVEAQTRNEDTSRDRDREAK